MQVTQAKFHCATRIIAHYLYYVKCYEKIFLSLGSIVMRLVAMVLSLAGLSWRAVMGNRADCYERNYEKNNKSKYMICIKNNAYCNALFSKKLGWGYAFPYIRWTIHKKKPLPIVFCITIQQMPLLPLESTCYTHYNAL